MFKPKDSTKRFLFIFLDGVGLGTEDPTINPFITANTPNFDVLLAGRKLTSKTNPFESEFCTLIGLDAQLKVAGLPQSATGQAALVTGVNFAEKLGYHFGPKPNAEIRSYFLSNGQDKQNQNSSFSKDDYGRSVFSEVIRAGKTAGFLNAYPPPYFHGISSGRHIHSVIPLAAATAGIKLLSKVELFNGKGMSADFTGQGWRDQLNINGVPILSPAQAGKKLAELASQFDFSMFEYWASDYAGHKQNFQKAIQLLETLDEVIGSLIKNWNFQEGSILITSDHGNLEDLSTRKHTSNQVPGFLIGSSAHRLNFSDRVKSITDITPFILDQLSV
jgi:2,3-bisphosphoglycerate-independent phosphoglycerate mutase